MVENHPPANIYLDQIFNNRRGVNPENLQRKWLDISYAPQSPAQKLDIYLPNEGTGPFSIIMAIHGGSFVRGDKRDFQIVPIMEALKRNYAVVAINYRLSNEAQFPCQINDVKAAIRWIRANGGKYTLNPEKIAVWGDSAGGNLAALAGTSCNVKELEDLSMGNPDQSSHVDAVVDWYGPINFLTMGNQLKQQKNVRKSNSNYIAKTKEEAPELYIAASPETYIRPGLPPFFIQHGNADQIIPIQQSIDFATKLENISGKEKVVFEIIEGADHLDEKFTSPENINKVLDFLDNYLK
ncbi:MAG TPA: alpha/beta hydrolase [Fibrobacteres bacterium]|nr:alpha/beta hydrolase [Fibrobacterota bacterium]